MGCPTNKGEPPGSPKGYVLLQKAAAAPTCAVHLLTTHTSKEVRAAVSMARAGLDSSAFRRSSLGLATFSSSVTGVSPAPTAAPAPEAAPALGAALASLLPSAPAGVLAHGAATAAAATAVVVTGGATAAGVLRATRANGRGYVACRTESGRVGPVQLA
jgi:hypothetical protein